MYMVSCRNVANSVSRSVSYMPGVMSGGSSSISNSASGTSFRLDWERVLRDLDDEGKEAQDVDGPRDA